MKELGPDIRGVAEDSLAAIKRGQNVYVEGPVGSGRSSLIEALRTQVDAVVVELLPIVETDAPAAALVELTAGLPPPERPRLTRGDGDEFFQAARAIGAALAALDRVVIVRLPASWAQVADRGDPALRHAADARTWLEGVRSCAATVVIVADAAISPQQIGLHRWFERRLAPHRVPLRALEAVPWRDYQHAYESLAGAVSIDRRESPLAWRLAVGGVALGAPPREVIGWLDASSQAQTLTGGLHRLIAKEPELRECLRRVLLLRRPVPSDAFTRIAAPPSGHAPLFAQCLAYGDGATRIASPVRDEFRAQGAPSTAEDQHAHHEIAGYHRALDGSRAPWQLDPVAARAWSEKVHHLACSGDAGRDEWAQQELAAPEQYWDCARPLSIDARRYHEAAAIYRACVDRFPHDDYGWHYLGWNLARAGGRRAEAEHALRKAVETSPENPWWNSRLVTFLIHDGQPGAAQREWAEAEQRVDPDGQELARSSWLAEHMHHWVIEAWFNAGRAWLAGSVLRSIPQQHLPRRLKARTLHRRVREAERASGDTFDWRDFLSSLATRCELTEAHAGHARDAWARLRALGGPQLPLPAVQRTTDQTAIQFCWSYASALLEVEVDADGAVSWFGLDRSTQRHEGGDGWETETALRTWLGRVIDG